MADELPPKAKTLIGKRRSEDNSTTDIDDDDDDDDDEEEEEEKEEEVVENLEEEVKKIAESILRYRETLPNQLKQTFTSLLLSQRPSPTVVANPFPPPSQTGTLIAAEAPNSGVEDNLNSSKVALLGAEDPETAEKIRLLKLKIASNVSVMPVVLKRMNECISMIDKLDSEYANIDAFKRKRMY